MKYQKWLKYVWVVLLFLPMTVMAAKDHGDKTEQDLMSDIANAKTPEDKGLAIANMMDFRNLGWKDSEAKMQMILRNRQGDESVRDVRVRNLEVIGDGDKGLSIFDTPRDVKGTAVLTWSHALKPDEQWIYLPALKRVKRISSKNKSGPFMGSEFAYEDIASQEVDKFTYKYLRDEQYDGMDCYVSEHYPAYKYSGYTRQISWVDKEHFRPRKTVFYDRKNSLLKTVVYKNYKTYLGKYLRPHEMFMENHQTGKSTKLKWSEYKFGTGFTDRDFDKNALKRVR